MVALFYVAFQTADVRDTGISLRKIATSTDMKSVHGKKRHIDVSQVVIISAAYGANILNLPTTN
jgi:hypothetical protein